MAKWFTDFKADFLKKEFWTLKILYFFMIGGMSTLFPFLTIQARSLGITEEELGIIYSLLPVTGLLGPSIAGLFADKIGNFKILLSFCVTCSGLAALLFVFIPPGRIEHVLPEQIPLTINCSMSNNIFSVYHPYTCDPKNNTNGLTLNVNSCDYRCHTNGSQNHLLIRNLLENWCNDIKNCFLYTEVAVDDIIELPINSSSVPYSVGDPLSMRNTFHLNMNNLTLPIKLTLSNENIYEMGFLSTFCPKEINEVNGCWLECKAFTNTSEVCGNERSLEVLSPSLTIIIYIIVRLINSITIGTSMTLFEGAVVAIIKQSNGDLGLQRLYGNLGMIVLTPISGKLIDYFSSISSGENYISAFVFYCCIKIFCAILLLFINLDFKLPSSTVLRDFKELMTQSRVCVFIMYVLIAGISNGFLETFLFWLLEDLGADKGLMGLTVTVGAVFGIPLLMSSIIFIKKLGHVNTLSLCMVLYAVRLTGYSLIRNPWLAMPFEAMEAFTNSLMSVTCVSYATILSKPSTIASLLGIYGGTYHGAARGIGSFAGGIMIKNFGNATTFQILAGTCGIGGVIYYIINKFVFGSVESVNAKDVCKEKGQEELEMKRSSTESEKHNL